MPILRTARSAQNKTPAKTGAKKIAQTLRETRLGQL
jgi:hypothetical protein